jgi:cytochrome c peroxidase
VPPQNPITEPKRVLGKILFWDEQMSTSMVVSCGTCHIPGRAGADPRLAQHPGADGLLGTPDDVNGSPGVIKSSTTNAYLRDAIFALRPQVTDRAAQPTVDAAYAPELFWDGRAKGEFRDPLTSQVLIPAGGALENQAIGPILNNVEMAHAGLDWSGAVGRLKNVQPLALGNNRPADIAAALADRPNYPELFRRAFGTADVTPARIAMALATYQRTLIADDTPLDRFQAGLATALTPAQQRGLNAFSNVNGANCVACHTLGNGLGTDFSFRNIGLRPPGQDSGRAAVSGNNADRGKFKVPGLRNVGLKRTFMHTGQFTTLQQVIGFYAGSPGRVTPNNIAPLGDNIDPVMVNVRIPPPPPGGGGAGADIADFLANALTDARVATQTFPFDKPVLFTERQADQAVLMGGQVATTGDGPPAIIVQSPPLIGSSDFRIGLDVPAALAGAQAILAVSTSPPVNGRVQGAELKGPVAVAGHAAGANATLHWPLTPGSVAPGQVVYVQWQIATPAAPGGEARSQAAQLTFFCGSMGCPPRCAADFDASQTVTIDDVFTYLNAWFAGNARADASGDGALTIDDLFVFISAWFAGC